jgi:hypothetical protein
LQPRETVQTAEDAREIAVKKIDEQRSADERQAFKRCRQARRLKPMRNP